jgi:hypothetical protein
MAVAVLFGEQENTDQSIALFRACAKHVRFSNRPFGVKHFQTIRRYSGDAAHGLALLLGIGTKALSSWDSRTRWNNLYRGLAVKPTAGPSSGHANSPHPPSREGHQVTQSIAQVAAFD